MCAVPAACVKQLVHTCTQNVARFCGALAWVRAKRVVAALNAALCRHDGYRRIEAGRVQDELGAGTYGAFRLVLVAKFLERTAVFNLRKPSVHKSVTVGVRRKLKLLHWGAGKRHLVARFKTVGQRVAEYAVCAFERGRGENRIRVLHVGDLTHARKCACCALSGAKLVFLAIAVGSCWAGAAGGCAHAARVGAEGAGFANAAAAAANHV